MAAKIKENINFVAWLPVDSANAQPKALRNVGLDNWTSPKKSAECLGYILTHCGTGIHLV